MADVSDILSRLLGGGQGEGGRDSALLAPLADLIQRQGGVEGLMAQLRNSGLSEQVASWVGPGENAKADPRQLARALGPDSMRELARKSSLPVERVAHDLGELIPELLAKASAAGGIPVADQAAGLARRIPGADHVLDQASSRFSGLRGRSKPPEQREPGDS